MCQKQYRSPYVKLSQQWWGMFFKKTNALNVNLTMGTGSSSIVLLALFWEAQSIRGIVFGRAMHSGFMRGSLWRTNFSTMDGIVFFPCRLLNTSFTVSFRFYNLPLSFNLESLQQPRYHSYILNTALCRRLSTALRRCLTVWIRHFHAKPKITTWDTIHLMLMPKFKGIRSVMVGLCRADALVFRQ